MPWLPQKLFNDWPSDAVGLDAMDVRRLYEAGFAGATKDQSAVDEFQATQEHPNAEDASHRFGLAETGAGKLVIPFVFVLEMFPGCWPGVRGQGRGDCVAWNTRNAALGTMVTDIVTGTPDEVTGHVEGPPEVPPDGVADGVLSTESFYWHRGYDGDGWMCHTAANVATKKSGLFIRKNYPELGVDLTKYNASTAGKYGSKSPPEAIQKVGREHLVRQATEASGIESVRDLLFNGYYFSTCGGEGYQDTRDENGVSKQSGSWAHAMACIAVDDREWAKRTYRYPLVLILNSWARWNSGPRDIYDSASMVPANKKDEWIAKGIVNPKTGNIMIPEGSFWTPWNHAKNREWIAFSGVNGFPRRQLPDWGAHVFG